MKEQKVTPSELARRMGTGRNVVERLLKADNLSVTLSTISKAGRALGQTFRIRVA